MASVRLPAPPAGLLHGVEDPGEEPPGGGTLGGRPPPSPEAAGGLRRGGPRRFKAGAKHAGAASRTASSRLWGALAASTSAGRPSAPAAGTLARTLVRDILALDGEGGRAGGLAAAELESDEAYRRPLTVPGIDPKAAVALVAGIDASLLPGHNRLAS